jgi:hypothetical protein
MAKSPTSVRDDNMAVSRRALIKWTIAAGAALGVSRSKIYEILEKTGGKGLAFAAAANPTHRSIHFDAGNGGAAWWTQLVPIPDVASANNPNFSYHAPGTTQLVAGTDRPLHRGTTTPFTGLPAAKEWTAFVAGRNATHSRQTPNLNGNAITAIASVLQRNTPTLIPIVQVGNATVGTATGAPQPAAVNNAAAIVGLFNSAASQANGLLSKPANAQLYKAQFDAFAQLNRAASRPTQKSSYVTGSSAASFLGTNLAARLAITPADRLMYGVDNGTPGNVSSIADALIVATKAFSLGLMNSIVVPFMQDDPHGAFDNNSVGPTSLRLKKIFDGFQAHATATLDSATGQPIFNDTVITAYGDTYKAPFDTGGWGDGTPNNSNIIFAFLQGHVFSGWLGNIGQNNVQMIQPNGTLAAYNTAQSETLAAASIAYAIAKRDTRAISQFANGINPTFWRAGDIA